MRDDSSATTKALLAQAGLDSLEQLWALGGGHGQGGVQATALLASTAALALIRVDDAERRADICLRQLAERTATQSAAAADGNARTADWVLQAANQYADEVATIRRQGDLFTAAAHPLAALLGVGPFAADTTPPAAASGPDATAFA